MCSSGLFRSYHVLCLCAAVLIMLPHDVIAADENHCGLTEYEIVSKAPMVIGKSGRTTSYFMNINVYSDPDLNLHSYSTLRVPSSKGSSLNVWGTTHRQVSAAHLPHNIS